MEPLVSIGLPVYNCAGTIGKCIKSILLQSYSNWELLIMDDGSTDDTVAIAKSFNDPRISVHGGDSNKGLPTRLNELLDLSKGTFFCRMDGDDICFPERIKSQVNFLLDHPEINLVGSSALIIDGENKPRGMREVATGHDDIVRTPYKGFSFMHPTLMGRMEWFRKYKYKNIRRVEDQDLYFRSYKDSRFANMREALIAYRELDYSYKKSHTGRKNYYMAISSIYLHNRDVLPLIKATFFYLLKETVYLIDSYLLKGGIIMRVRNRATVPQKVSERYHQLLLDLKND